MDFDAPVREVTVLEDRASVTRRGQVRLNPGLNRLRVAEVAPILADKTLCGAVKLLGVADDEDAAPRVTDIRMRRQQVARPQERTDATQALLREQKTMQVAMAKQEAEVDRLRHQLSGVEAIEHALVDELAVDVAWGREATEAWSEGLTQTAAEVRRIRDTLLTCEDALRLESEIFDNLAKRIAEASQVRDTIRAELIVEVMVATAGTYEVRLDYIVPGACWRPQHRAQLLDTAEGVQVAFTSEGCVWQATGEDWLDVQLTFSTERPSLGTQPPQLSTEILHTRKKQDHIQVQVREQTIATTGVDGGQPSEDLPGIDDGGDALALRALHRIDVHGDGRPHRVALMHFEDAVVQERTLMAELEPAVVIKTEQQNRGPHPVLAGPVDLIREGGLVGRGKVMFVAPGERFEMGWGPEAAVRVRRSVDHNVEESSMLSSWTTQTHKVALRLSNLGGDPISLRVQERVAISEIEKVKISVLRDKTTAGKAPDSHGFVTWDVSLAPSERKTIKLAYSVKKHADVSGI